MDEQSIIDAPLTTLFEAEGQINEIDALLLEKKYNVGPVRRAEGETSVRFRERSRFSIADPLAYSIEKLLRPEQLPSSIQSDMNKFEFYMTRLACSFDPAEGCRFHDARFEIKLFTVPTDPAALPGEAIAYDLSPMKSEDKRIITDNYKLSPEIEINKEVSLTLPFYEKSIQYTSNTSYLEAVNPQGPNPEWKFTHTSLHRISGSQLLFMLVRKPKGTHVQATFQLKVHAQFLIGDWAPEDLIPLSIRIRRRGSPPAITDPTVPLC
jgi:hypothetical protein